MPKKLHPLAPMWASYGGTGLLIAAATLVIPWLVRRQLANEPTGDAQRPLAPKKQTPLDKRLFVYPVATTVGAEDLADVWARRLESFFGAAPSQAQMGILMGQSIVASGSPDGLTVVNNNPLRLRANRFYRDYWTTVRVPEWGSQRPVHRWLPIRSYLSLDAAAFDWLTQMPEAARGALQAADPDAYAKALVAARAVDLPARAYVPELVAAASSWLDSNA